MDVAHGSREVRAFTFKRNSDSYVVFWHISGNKELELPLNSKNITLLGSLEKKYQFILTKMKIIRYYLSVNVVV